MNNPTQELIYHIRQDKAFIRYIVQYRDAYGLWLWHQVFDQLYKETGWRTYHGIPLIGSHLDMKLLNELIAEL